MCDAPDANILAAFADLSRKGVCTADATVLGHQTRHRAIVAEHVTREWLQDAPKCPLLKECAIAHLGIADAHRPYGFIRASMPVTEFIGCVAGEGRVFIDGQWLPLRSGQAALLPIYQPAAYSATSAEPWQLVWVCYEGTVSEKTNSPVIGNFAANALLHTLEALLAECSTDNGGNPSCLHALITTVHRYVLQFAQLVTHDGRLSLLWEKVVANLGDEWTLDRLSQEAHCCGEHLRRLCQAEVGRSPMQQVTHLRLQRAAELLLHTNYKVEYISSMVGYTDAFAFSTMFKKRMGCRPTEYRQRLLRGEGMPESLNLGGGI